MSTAQVNLVRTPSTPRNDFAARSGGLALSKEILDGLSVAGESKGGAAEAVNNSTEPRPTSARVVYSSIFSSGTCKICIARSRKLDLRQKRDKKKV